MDLDYTRAQESARARYGIAKSGSSLLEQWASLVQECSECYAWDVSEYNHELAVRDQLAVLLDAPELSEFTEHDEFRERVLSIDARFRALLITGVALPNRSSWWRAGVLSRAGRPYTTYFREAHGIAVELCVDEVNRNS